MSIEMIDALAAEKTVEAVKAHKEIPAILQRPSAETCAVQALASAMYFQEEYDLDQKEIVHRATKVKEKLKELVR